MVMKKILFLLSLVGCLSVFAQKLPETCNQLPYAKVEQKAEITNDVNRIVESQVPQTMKKGDFNANYKFYVDCKGVIDKLKYSTGNLNEEQQTWLSNALGKIEWKAAVTENTYVTSVVFVKVSIINGQATVEVF
jgi:hypothetical protein